MRTRTNSPVGADLAQIADASTTSSFISAGSAAIALLAHRTWVVLTLIAICVSLFSVSPAIAATHKLPSAPVPDRESIAARSQAHGTAHAAASTACMLVFGEAQSCQSEDPSIAFNFKDNGDAYGCTFDVTVNWGDASPEQSYTVIGAGPGFIPVASHTYATLGAYAITTSGVVAAGECTIEATAAYSFTLQAKAAPIPRTISCGARSLLDVGELHGLSRATACSVWTAALRSGPLTKCIGKPFTAGAYPVIIKRAFRGWTVSFVHVGYAAIRFARSGRSFFGGGEDVPPYPC